MISIVLSIIFSVPLLIGCLALVIRRVRVLGIINAVGYGIIFLAAALLMHAVPQVSYCAQFLYIDALGSWFIVLVALVSFLAALYSIHYVDDEVSSGGISDRKSRIYYMLFNACVLAMLAVTVINNLGMMWAAVEMTTLTSAFLVGFHNNKHSVEAAWKYLIICSVGITLALFGIILLYHTASLQGGIDSLNWTDMFRSAPWFDPRTVRIAMVFLIVGFGTKAGFAPLHTWLPDAHSQAFSPISALLSGALIKMSLYALIRTLIIVNRCIGPNTSGDYLIGFGCLSLLLAAGFMLVQKDIKRLLAYSSIEHIGIIATGLGIGGPLGVTGALWHVFNHGTTKAFMFFGAGTAVRHYKTHTISAIRGMTIAMPFVGICGIAGVLALGGMPPFSIFFSELTVLIAGFQAKQYAVCTVVLVSLAVAFAALIYHYSRMLFNKAPDELPKRTEPFSAKITFMLAFIIMLATGLAAGVLFGPSLKAAVDIIVG
jgi:hydrogenase-4 component F